MIKLLQSSINKKRTKGIGKLEEALPKLTQEQNEISIALTEAKTILKQIPHSEELEILARIDGYSTSSEQAIKDLLNSIEEMDTLLEQVKKQSLTDPEKLVTDPGVVVKRIGRIEKQKENNKKKLLELKALLTNALRSLTITSIDQALKPLIDEAIKKIKDLLVKIDRAIEQVDAQLKERKKSYQHIARKGSTRTRCRQNG